jgi:hypothetical protein
MSRKLERPDMGWNGGWSSGGADSSGVVMVAQLSVKSRKRMKGERYWLLLKLNREKDPAM